MTIKRQFQLYVAALAIVPTVVAALLAGGFVVFSEESAGIHLAMEQRRWVDAVLRPAIEKNDLSGVRSPEEFHVIVGGPGGDIVLSTVDGAPVGAPFEPPRRDPGAAEDAGATPIPERGLSLIIEAVETDEGLYRIVQAFPALTREDFFRRSRFLFLVALAFFGLLFLGAVGGILSVSSLQRDILSLQRATRRISSGDLDFHIEAPGQSRGRVLGEHPSEIDQLAMDLDTMRRRLKEEQARRSRFLMAVSHDLATPLTTIRGYIEAMQDGLINTEEQKLRSLAAIRNKTDLLESRIVELIEFVRLETGEWRMKNEPFALKSFLEELASGFRQDSDVARRRFSAEISIAEDEVVQGDRSLLLRVFENLFHNALRFTEEGDALSLRAEREESGDIAIEFRDTGPGFAEENPDNLLEPFARGSQARNEPGFGLGLATAASIVRSHGWGIRLSNSSTGGAVVAISIPRSMSAGD
jgi:signal transduction histidine kinase